MPAVAKSTLHDSLREQLILEMRDLPIDQRLPSDRQLAKRFQVSLMTVVKVMQSLQRDGYVDRLQGKGTLLAAREKRIRSERVARRQGAVVVATPNHFSHEYWNRSYLADGLARRNALRTIDFRFGGAAGWEGLLELLRQEPQLTGLVLEPVPGSLTRDAVDALDAIGVPVVLFSACDWLSFATNIYAIVPDWFQTGYLAASRLLDAGRNRLALVDNEPNDYGDAQVRIGVKQALYERGLRLKDLIRPAPRCRPGDDSRQVGYEMTREALEAGADACIWQSYGGALGGYRAIYEAGLRLPTDLSGISCGGFADQELFMAPPLSTVESSHDWELETAFKVLLEPTRPASKMIVSEVTLADRASVSPPLADR